METRANYVIVGSFMITLLVAALFFVLWISRFDFGSEGSYYDILFEGSVSGLRDNEDIRYHGIPIGKIKKIDIDPANPNRVRVRVKITETHLIHKDVIASIEAQGLTGYSYIQIQGGSPNSPLLEPTDRKPYPIIPSQPSKLDMLFSNAPHILNRVNELSEQLNQLFNEENRQEVQKILKNMSVLSTQLASGKDSLESLVTVAKKTFNQADQTMINLNKYVSHSLQDVSKITEDIRGALQQSQGGVNNALNELPRTLKNIRIAAEKLQKLANTIEQNPLDLLNKNNEQGYKIP